MEEKIEQYLARGFSGAGIIAGGQLLFIDFPLLEPALESSTTQVRVCLPLIQLEALIGLLDQLRTIPAAAPGSPSQH